MFDTANSLARRFTRRLQGGFAVLTLLLAALVLMGVLAAVFALSRTSMSTSTETARANAAAILTQSNNIAIAYQTMISRGTLNSAITYDNAATTGLTNPTAGGLSLQVPPAKAFATGATQMFWAYKQNAMKVKGVGIDNTGDYGFVLANLDQTVCQEINRLLTNSATIPASTLASTAFLPASVTSTAPTDSAAVDMSAVAAVTGLMQSCVSTSDTKYVYYVVVDPL